MPLDPALAKVLMQWQRKTEFTKPEDWIFASPFKGSRGGCSSAISHLQPSVAASVTSVGIRSNTLFEVCLTRLELLIKVQQ